MVPQWRGGRGSGLRNFGERKSFVEKILVEHLFPPNVRPASVLIGVRGTNHARLQSSGCCVQLRGKGCSPDPASNEGPIHLLVKYDSLEELARLKEILSEIVAECSNQISGGARRVKGGGGMHQQMLPAAADGGGTSSNPASARLLLGEGGAHLDNWVLAERRLTPKELQAEGELLWLVKVFLSKEQTVPLADLASGIAAFFHLQSLEDRLAHTSAPGGAVRLDNFVKSCPHVIKCVPAGDGAGSTVSLVDSAFTLTKEQLKELHANVRNTQHQLLQERKALAGDEQSLQQQLTALLGNCVSINGNSAVPLDAITIMAQAIHLFLSQQPKKELLLSDLASTFEAASGVPFAPSMFGYEHHIAFFQAMPTIFRVIEPPGGQVRVAAVDQPNFANVFAPPPTKVGFLALAKALRANAAAAQQQRLQQQPPPGGPI